MLTTQEITQDAYVATNGEYIYGGFTADQWRELAESTETDRDSAYLAYFIAAALDGLNN